MKKTEKTGRISTTASTPPKGGSLSDGRPFLKKNFQVPERIPLSALVPAHMAAPLPGEAAPLPGEAARAPVGWPPTSRRLTSTAALNDSGLPMDLPTALVAG